MTAKTRWALAALSILACTPPPSSPSSPSAPASATRVPPSALAVVPPVGADPHPNAEGYVGSLACASCHRELYDRWRKTPMANVVRDPRSDPSAILPDLTTNTISPFAKGDVALVYGSLWKQRYFTKIGDDYFPQSAQWDVTHRVWRKYFVEKSSDWWTAFYPADNMKRPTGPLCDGCHSVGYDVSDKRVIEWNVGCERCHGPGAAHVARPSRANVIDPKRQGSTRANDACIQCHSQGRTLTEPSVGNAFDWPVGYRVGLDLKDFWKLEEHELGKQTFTHFADGTAHKNRMQGNDFVQSKMYRHGVTCANCHDVHGTDNPAQLRLPANAICLTCHSPGSRNGPRAASIAAHTRHAETSAASECIACHMPKIETTIADVNVRAHTFSFITPAMTDRYGVPNPCTTCHKDKSTAWATSILALPAQQP